MENKIQRFEEFVEEYKCKCKPKYEIFLEYVETLPKDFVDFKSLGVPAWMIEKYFFTGIVGERSDRVNLRRKVE